MAVAQAQNKKSFLPDLADIIFLLLLYFLLSIRPDMIFADGSTGWHLVCGNYIWHQHWVPYVDIMSYTFAGKPWIAFEWLSDLFMSALVYFGGLNLLAVIVSSAIAFLFFLIYRHCRAEGCNFVLALIFTMTGALLSAIHWLIRPHVFTFFGVYIFYTQLDAFYRGQLTARKLAMRLGLCMLIWVNCHPGFLFGLALLLLYLVSASIENLFTKEVKFITPNIAGVLSCVLLVMVLITFINPYGIGIYNIAGYFYRNTSVTQFTDEFLSPVFHGGLQPTLLEAFFVFFIIGLIIGKEKIKLPDLLIFLLMSTTALAAKRHIALFVIVAIPIIARLYGKTILHPPDGALFVKLKGIWRTLIERLAKYSEDFSNTEKLCDLHLLPIVAFIALVVIAVSNGQALGVTILRSDFPETSIPNNTLTIIKEMKLDPKRGMSLDNWGGVIRYKLDYPVFIDDRSDFYGEDFFIQYGKLLQAAPGWQKILDRYQINWILLPPNYRLVQELSSNPHWRIAAEDKAAILLLRNKQ